MDDAAGRILPTKRDAPCQSEASGYLFSFFDRQILARDLEEQP